MSASEPDAAVMDSSGHRHLFGAKAPAPPAQGGALCHYLLHFIWPSTTVAIAPPWNVLPWKGELRLRDAD
jgi:hypothetical protein